MFKICAGTTELYILSTISTISQVNEVKYDSKPAINS